MLVDLPPELERLVDSKVQSGRYRSVSDVVREALQLLEQRDEMFTLRKEGIHRQIEEGWQSAQRGEFVDGEEVFDRLESELNSLIQSTSK